MEFLTNFGFEPKLLLAQIINFVIVLWVLKKFLYKPVLEMLKKRQEAIEKGLHDAQEAEKRLAQAEEKQKIMLREAQEEAKKIIEDAKNHGTELLKLAEERALQLGEKMIQDAKDQINVQTEAAEKKLRTSISRIALEFLEKSVGELFEEEDQEKIMSKAIKRLEKKAN